MTFLDSFESKKNHTKLINTRWACVLFTTAVITSLPSPAAAQSGPRTTPEIVNAAAAAKPDICPGPVQPTWDSIRTNYTVPAWFVEAKFGITMHWGLFSVAAYHNEWYEKYMYGTFVTFGQKMMRNRLKLRKTRKQLAAELEVSVKTLWGW